MKITLLVIYLLPALFNWPICHVHHLRLDSQDVLGKHEKYWETAGGGLRPETKSVKELKNC